MIDPPISPMEGLPCCGYPNHDAVRWNPYNRVVQCHNCGTQWVPVTQGHAS